MKNMLARIGFLMTLGLSQLMPMAALAQAVDAKPPEVSPSAVSVTDGTNTTWIGLEPRLAITIVVGIVLLAAAVFMAMASRSHSDTHVIHH